MAKTKAKVKVKSDGELLDQATSRLLQSLKSEAAKTGKPIKKEELLAQGYSERFIAKVEEA